MQQRADINITQMNFTTAVTAIDVPQVWPDAVRWLQLPNPYILWIALAIKGTATNKLYWRVQTPDGVIIPDNVSWMLALPGHTPIYEIDKKLFGPPYYVRVYTYGTEVQDVGFSFFSSEQAGYSDLVTVNNTLEKILEAVRVIKGPIIPEPKK